MSDVKKKRERLPLYLYLYKFYESIQYSLLIFTSIIVIIFIPVLSVWTLYYLFRFNLARVIGGFLVLHILLGINSVLQGSEKRQWKGGRYR